jgi:molecular chaperone DnaK (HSP70)
MISGYLGGGEDFDQAIADFAIAYADQNEQDYRRLLQAVSDARVLATVGQ